MVSLRLVLSLVALAIPSASAAAQTAERPQRLAFVEGVAKVQGRIKGHKYDDYVFAVGAGEPLKAFLTTANTAAYFNLMAPGETEAAFFIGSTSGAEYRGVAPTSGDYTVRVYMVRNAARRGEVAHYTMTVALGQKSFTNEKGPDYADGLTGGPDYWQVTGVAAGDTLSLRGEASPRGRLLAKFASGTVLRNLGCKNTQGQRWCRVQQIDTQSVQGWVNGRYLSESAAAN